MRKHLVTVAALAALVATASSAAAQCAMCKTALTQSPEGQRMVQGFNTGILFLLVMPYLVFGTIALSLWWTRRQRPSEEARGHKP